MTDARTESDHFSDFDEDEKMMLESRIKKNQATQPANFTTLYALVAFMTVFTISYLFHTVLELDCLVPANAALFLVAGLVTCYLLSDSYMQLYETESNKGMSDLDGRCIKELEDRRVRKAESIKNRKNANVAPPTKLRTAKELFTDAGGNADNWKNLSNDEKEKYIDQELAEEVAYLGVEVAHLRNLQYQKSMGWSLFFCNTLFIFSSLLISQVILKKYDNRVNYLISTLLTGLLTQLVTKYNDDAVKAKSKGGKKVAKN